MILTSKNYWLPTSPKDKMSSKTSARVINYIANNKMSLRSISSIKQLDMDMYVNSQTQYKTFIII